MCQTCLLTPAPGRLDQLLRRIFTGKGQGMTLIETLVALAIVAAVAVVFLSGLTTSFKAVMVSQERVAVESLAKSQMEDIKAQPYITVDEYNPNDPDKSYQLIVISSDLAAQGYTIAISPPEVVADNVSTIQKITVTVSRNEEAVLTVSDYKVDR